MNVDTLEKVKTVLRAQAMRDHPFQPMKRDQRYCGWMGPAVTSGSERTGYVSMRTECGYPPDLHPQPIGSGPSEHARTRRARRSYLCQEQGCRALIRKGDWFVSAVLFPSHDMITSDRPVQWRFCVRCASRYGRPLPPVAAPRGEAIDPEAVDIVVRGIRVVRLNRRERVQAVRLLSEAGKNTVQIAVRVGITVRSVQRIRARIKAAAQPVYQDGVLVRPGAR